LGGEFREQHGTTRPVFADGEWQYAINEGERVYGLFILPEEDRCDAPVIVDKYPETYAAKEPAQALKPKDRSPPWSLPVLQLAPGRPGSAVRHGSMP
jgi:hypothetical protein